MRPPRITFAAGALALVAASGCLPRDTRPPPGSVEFTATNAGTLNVDAPELVTSDGWTLSYDRFLIAIGNGSLDGSNCDVYAEADYRRILDVRRVGAQKVGTMYALRHCDIGFTLRLPDPDSVLGAGVTEADSTFMRTPVPDDYTMTVNGGLGSGIAVYVQGTARRAQSVERFAWAFRRRFNYRNCSLPVAGALVQGVDFKTNQAERIDIGIHGEALFLDSLDVSTAHVVFDPIASADTKYGDANGEVTLHELSLVPLKAVFPSGVPTADDGGIDAGAWTTLEDFVYLGLVLEVARVGDIGVCQMDVTDRRRE